MRILICGDRNFRDAKRVYKFLKVLPPDTIIIEGEAKGADTIVWVCCEILGLKYMPFPADWAAYHKAAGVKRNKQMLEMGKPDLILWYHDNLVTSKGTANMIAVGEEAGVPISEGPKYND